MATERNHIAPGDSKTIVVLAECLNGACEAGGFAARHLLDQSSRIILLHTYDRPRSGIGLMRDITHILRETAEQEIRNLKKQLMEDLCIPEERIEMMAIQGELKSVINSYFRDDPNLSFVLGQGIGQLPHNGACRDTIKTLISSGARPIFLISGFITIIENNKVSVIADKEESVPQAYINFLSRLGGKLANMNIEIISSDNRNSVRIDKDTVNLFANTNSYAGERKLIEEHLLIKRMVR